MTDKGTKTLELIPVTGLPEVASGDRIADLVDQRTTLQSGDVVVVSSKIVAKAEGRVVPHPGTGAERQELVEQQSVRILRRRDHLLVTETPHGFVCANAGVDWSNVPLGHAALLPVDPDRSARRIRDGLRAISGCEVGVVVTDTFGRPWRKGVVDVALGSAGITPVRDLRGTADDHGNVLQGTQVCVADEIASAAELVMGKTGRVPVVVVRGLPADVFGPGSISADVVRKPQDDWFR